MLNSDEAGWFLLKDSGVYVLKLKLEICLHLALSDLSLKNLNFLHFIMKFLFKDPDFKSETLEGYNFDPL